MLHDDPEGIGGDWRSIGVSGEGTMATDSPGMEQGSTPSRRSSTPLSAATVETYTIVCERPVDLVFTSPPYFNARPELGCFEDYEESLVFLKSFIEKVGRVLVPGRFFVLNIAPVIVPSERR